MTMKKAQFEQLFWLQLPPTPKTAKMAPNMLYLLTCQRRPCRSKLLTWAQTHMLLQAAVL